MNFITVTLIVCVVGFLVWYLNSRREKPDAVIGEAGKWAYILGLASTLAGVIGKVAL